MKSCIFRQEPECGDTRLGRTFGFQKGIEKTRAGALCISDITTKQNEALAWALTMLLLLLNVKMMGGLLPGRPPRSQVGGVGRRARFQVHPRVPCRRTVTRNQGTRLRRSTQPTGGVRVCMHARVDTSTQQGDGSWPSAGKALSTYSSFIQT